MPEHLKEKIVALIKRYQWDSYKEQEEAEEIAGEIIALVKIWLHKCLV